jgi:hypothetical protein
MESNASLRRQLEQQEEEHKRLRSRFQAENSQLRDMLLQLTEELSKLQSRLREQSPQRLRSTPQTSSAPSESAASPTQQGEPTICWPSRIALVDCETQCAAEYVDCAVQCNISVSQSNEPVKTPDRPIAFSNALRTIEDESGLITTPRAPADSQGAPSLAREADRLLSVITRLRAERSTPQSIGKR